MFGPRMKFITTDKSPDEDTSPKPTIFLPSEDERKLHKTGTYLCLLEDFFSDVINIDWKEKNGKTVLKSQQGDTMKMKDTYMKYTWLTVSEESMDKEHQCIVTHEKNKGGVDQEILFPSTGKADLVTESKAGFQTESERSTNTKTVTPSPLSTLSSSPFSSAADPTRRKTTENSYSTGAQDASSPVTDTTPSPEFTAVISTEASMKHVKDENETLRLQAMNTSAYYTYVLLLLKSVIYSIIITYFLLGRPALCDWKGFAPWVHFSSLAIVTKRSEDIENLPF